MIQLRTQSIGHILNALFLLLGLFLVPALAQAASLMATPATGVYALGNTFTVRVMVNTSGQAINAAEGVLNFNPRELSVVRVDRANSVFSLWVTEPAFSNSAGTISFSGGSPTGYTGSAGTVFTIVFKALTAGPARVSYSSGSVLANDGRGTNVLSAMSGGTYTIEAATSQPAPEVVIEYVAPANTPAAPVITSTSHPDQNVWYRNNSAVLNWDLPSGIVAVRTLFDKNQNSIPSKVYDTPIQTITLNELEEGVSYFHLQFKNADGWGKVGRYKIAVDTANPLGFEATLSSTSDPFNPAPSVTTSFADGERGSPITRYRVSVNGAEPVELVVDKDARSLQLPVMEPGYYTVSIEAFDAAGNSALDTLTFTIAAFEPPIFTDYPAELPADVIPVLKGQTRPNAEVTVTISANTGTSQVYTLTADDTGVFTFIPESSFAEGVYRIRAQAVDSYGARSEVSQEIRIAVQKPGYLRFGSWLVSTLSVIVPLVGLVALLIMVLIWLIGNIKRLRGKVAVESREAVSILETEFEQFRKILESEQAALMSSKRTKKLTPTEENLFTSLATALQAMRYRITKEIKDVEDIVVRKDK